MKIWEILDEDEMYPVYFVRNDAYTSWDYDSSIDIVDEKKKSEIMSFLGWTEEDLKEYDRIWDEWYALQFYLETLQLDLGKKDRESNRNVLGN